MSQGGTLSIRCEMLPEEGVAVTSNRGSPGGRFDRAPASNDMEEYKILNELYKFYLDLVVKFNTFQLAITGGIVSYVFKDDVTEVALYALFVPTLFGAGAIAMVLVSFRKVSEVKAAVKDIAQRIRAKRPPHIEILQYALVLTLFAQLCVMSGMLIALFNPDLVLEKKATCAPTISPPPQPGHQP